MTINSSLRQYIEQTILPQYDHYDKGHNRDHITAVTEAAIELAANYDVELEMVYTAASFHDLGLVEGRDTHHLTSAKMLLADPFITHFFTPKQCQTIAEAIEDHRASAQTPPRTIYGEILSSADRIIVPDTIIIRTYYHSLKHYPDHTPEQQLNRIYQHITEKYGENGYLKIPILTQKNAEGLKNLRSLLRDENAFITHCKAVIAQQTSSK